MRHRLEREREASAIRLKESEQNLREAHANLDLALKSAKMGTWHFALKSQKLTTNDSGRGSKASLIT